MTLPHPLVSTDIDILKYFEMTTFVTCLHILYTSSRRMGCKDGIKSMVRKMIFLFFFPCVCVCMSVYIFRDVFVFPLHKCYSFMFHPWIP